MSLQMLVSVRDVAEAGVAAEAGADFIDLKDPAAGALGGLPVARIAEVVAALRAAGHRGKVSATIGDWPAEAVPAILAQVAAVAACGVDYVKVGVAPGPHAQALLQALATCGATVVPVFIADDGLAALPLAEALAHRAFPALMLDTQDKLGGSLLQRVPAAALQGFLQAVQGAGALAGLAGALRLADVPALQALAPDFAGFRSAVCSGHRANALEAARVRGLRLALRRVPQAERAITPAGMSVN
jgi:(5-formylfuran-3-yl)methyl phosphate synthase